MRLDSLKACDRILASLVNALPKKKRATPKAGPQKILFIKLSAMGDLLCLLPSIRMLAISFPNAIIDCMTTNRSNPGLFSRVPFINHVIVMPTSFKEIPFFVMGFLKKIREYDIVIDYEQYYQVSELFSYLGKASAGFSAPLKGKTFSIRVPYEQFLNEKLQFKLLTDAVISHFGATMPQYDFTLRELLTGFSPERKLVKLAESIASHSRKVIVIYPGSSSNASFRRLSIDKYRNVVQQLISEYVVVMAGGPDEIELRDELEFSSPFTYNLIGMLTLQEWAWFFMNYVDLIIGNDGGLLHMAESQAVPVVGIFGPALFRKWGSLNPLSKGVEVDMDCRPCLRNYLGQVPSSCRFGAPKCLDAVTPEMIVSTAESALTT